MKRPIVALTPLLLILFLVAGCLPEGFPAPPDDQTGGARGPGPTANIALQLPFLPIEFDIGLDGHVALALSSPQIATPLGTVTFSGGVANTEDGQPLPVQPAGKTQLIICASEGVGSCQAYRIDSGRKMKVQLNGQFLEEVGQNRVTIHASPGSTVEILDDGAPSLPAAYARSRVDVEQFYVSSTDSASVTDMNLEQSRSGQVRSLEYDRATGQLKLINGAQISSITLYPWSTSPTDIAPKAPTELDCQRSTSWSNNFTDSQLGTSKLLACIKTADSDLGYLYIANSDFWRTHVVYSYTWVR